uniref:Short neurotoxin 1 n=1 Tax=Bungarus fasciatus TaxID=8613 RepID=3S11_BUNFA|nr:RecName: Full=Short neurotoxin 1; AltName: Full=Toxin V-II-1 [Bungarus fasciatus]
RICLNQQQSTPEDQPTNGQCYIKTDCQNKTWNTHRGSRTDRGCGCPKVKPGINLRCCKTDKCNE